MGKLNVRSVADLTKFAIREGLTTIQTLIIISSLFDILYNTYSYLTELKPNR